MAKKLAYLGPAGTFTEEAALRYEPQMVRIPFTTISAVGNAVISGITDEGVVPIENSLEGSVNDTLDLLIRESKLQIRQELVLPIEHYLLTKEHAQLAEIAVIYSHPQALAQCRLFLEGNFPKAQMVAAHSTAMAVEEMKTSPVPAAAVATRRASELYGATIMAKGIQDSLSNVTRFAILSLTDHPRTGQDKTSLCFSFQEDLPGQLYGVMGEFAQRGINMAKVESRPTKEILGRYTFLVDVEGHREDPILNGALLMVGRRVSTLRIFGSYPAYSTKSLEPKPS